MDCEDIIITKQSDYDNFCDHLKTLEILYAEQVFDKSDDFQSVSKWLIYSHNDGKLEKNLVGFFGDMSRKFSISFKNAIWEATKSKLFAADSSDVLMSTERWLKPDLDSESYSCKIGKMVFEIEPSSSRIFWRTIINLYYRKFFFFDKSFMLSFLVGLCFYDHSSLPTAEGWERAILAQQFNDGLRFNDSFDEASEVKLGFYRAKESYAKIGEEKLRKLIVKCLPTPRSLYFDMAKYEFNVTPELVRTAENAIDSLHKAIKLEAGEHLTDKYAHFAVLNAKNASDVVDFLKKPQVLNFSKKADDEIREQILEDKFNSNLAEYYLRNQLFLADRKPVVELFEIVCHILRTTENASLFYVAGSVLNEIWCYLPKDLADDIPFRNVIYNLYWPRIKSLRRINTSVIYGCGTENPEDDIFMDAMTWILCIDYDKLVQVNPELGEYLKELATLPDDKIEKLPWWISSRIFGLKNDKLPLKQQFAKVIATFPPEHVGNNLGWCDSVDEAKLVLDSLLGQPTKKYRIEAKEICLEKLLMRRNEFDVKGYVLQRLIDDYDRFTKKFRKDRLSFFTAACEGAADSRELPLLEQLAKLFARLDNSDNTKFTIKKALNLARENIRTVNFQRKATSGKEFLSYIRKMAEIKPVEYDLDRFIKAQEHSHKNALKELSAGRKYGHYMWYTFPQLKGLGSSDNAEYYGIEDLNEAKAYMRNPILRQNILELCNAVANLEIDRIEDVFPFPDYLKLRSSATLFAEAAPEEKVFRSIIDKFYGGKLDTKTLELIHPRVRGRKDER